MSQKAENNNIPPNLSTVFRSIVVEAPVPRQGSAQPWGNTTLFGKGTSSHFIPEILVMLRQMSLTPERICGVKEGKIIYEMELGGLNHQFDVTRSWNGTMYYHSTDDRGGEGTVCIRPWGYTSIY